MSRIALEDMDVAMSAGPLCVRIADAGEMAVLHTSLPAGTDFTPQLRVVNPNACEVPHWLYVISGALHIGHNDGRVDVGEAGDVIYAEPGHTAWVEVDTEFVEVSPRTEIRDLLTKLTSGA
ncbi:MAG: hypothetical protein AB7R89_07855 [Dehalococcoidia bacterium]